MKMESGLLIDFQQIKHEKIWNWNNIFRTEIYVKCSFNVIDDCSHNVQYTKPHEASKIVREVLSK